MGVSVCVLVRTGFASELRYQLRQCSAAWVPQDGLGWASIIALALALFFATFGTFWDSQPTQLANKSRLPDNCR